MRAVHDVVDIVEVGTPALLRDGMGLVRRLRAAFPGVTLLADAKIMDGGHFEATLAFEAGADIVTVLAAADDATVSAALRAAEERGGRVMVDLIGVKEQARRARRVEALGAHFVCVHTPVDVQEAGTASARDGLASLRRVRDALRSAGLAVAGGLTADSLAEVVALAPDVVVVGSAIGRAADPRAEALRVRAALERARAERP